jgi:hypothetical protein
MRGVVFKRKLRSDNRRKSRFALVVHVARCTAETRQVITCNDDHNKTNIAFDATMEASGTNNCDAQQDIFEEDLDVKGQLLKAPQTQSPLQCKPQVEAMYTSTTSTWRGHSPPGSLMSIIRTHPHLRLYVDPLLWTPHHIQLLKVSVLVSETTVTRPHRPTCSKCNRCGKVPSSVLNLLQSYPYRTEKDRNLTRLVQSTIKSFRTSSGTPLFKTSKLH